jgi:hypothetical protein
LGKGSNTTTTSANPTATAYYNQLLAQAQTVGQTPYQAYSGQLVAPVNAQQTTGISNINANAGSAAPSVQQALGLAGGAANPLTQQQIQSYLNPYTQNVVNATQAQFNDQNAQASAKLAGNEISQGALGGNRNGIAQAALAGQQQTAQAPVIAGLYNTGYQNAVQTAAQQYQQNPLAAAGSIANFGLSGQNAALQGANAQIGAGTLQQNTQQQLDAAQLAQFQQQQAYPFQVQQWLAGIDTGVGSALGSSTTGPPPNYGTQLAGLGIAGAGLFLRDGGAVHRAASGGVSGFPYGAPSTPYGNVVGYVPTGFGLHAQNLTPAKTQGQDNSQTVKDITGYVNKWNKSEGDPAYGGGSMLTDAWGGSSSDPLSGLSAADYGAGFRFGGPVHKADAGGLGEPDWTDPSWYSPDVGAGIAPAGVDVFGDTNRGLGAKLLAAGMPATSASRGLGTPADSVNPDEPVRLDPEATDRWRKGVPPPVVAKDDPDETPDRGASAAPPLVRPTVPPYVAPSSADARAGLGTPAGEHAHSFGLGYLSPNVKQGLLAAGLGMLASRSPFLGTGIGEGGLMGLKAYGAANEADRQAENDKIKQAVEQRRVDMEAQRIQQEAQRSADTFATAQAGHAETARHNRVTEGQEDYKPIGSVEVEGVVHPLMGNSEGKVIDAVTGLPPDAKSKIKMKGDRTASLPVETARAIAEYQLATGDESRAKSLGMGGENKALIAAEMEKAKQAHGISDDEYSRRRQNYASNQVRLNQGARTQASREENLNMILRATAAAVPAALEESEKLERAGSIVPLNRIIQKGQLATSDPNLITFGMANLQLAEHWARAMNPLGVMRESDRDLALHYLDTALSKGTYKAAVMQLQKQVTRERDSIRTGQTTTPTGGAEPTPGASGPTHTWTPEGGAAGGDSTGHGGNVPAGAVGKRTDKKGQNWYVDSNGNALGAVQ